MDNLPISITVTLSYKTKQIYSSLANITNRNPRTPNNQIISQTEAECYQKASENPSLKPAKITQKVTFNTTQTFFLSSLPTNYYDHTLLAMLLDSQSSPS